MRGELKARDVAIATFQTELDNAKAEIEARDSAIANLQNQISGVVAGNNDQVLTIAELENQLSGVTLELKERDVAIANLKSELEAREDKQLSFFPPEPTQTPTPEPEPIPLILLDTIEGTVPRKVIMDRILEIDPATEINGQIITDAVLGHNQRLSELEITYGFKFVGYVMKGKNREYRYTIN